MTSAWQDCHSKVTLFAIALETPALLGVELDAKLAVEASYAEVDHVVVVEFGDLRSEEQIFVSHGVLCDAHERH